MFNNFLYYGIALYMYGVNICNRPRVQHAVVLLTWSGGYIGCAVLGMKTHTDFRGNHKDFHPFGQTHQLSQLHGNAYYYIQCLQQVSPLMSLRGLIGPYPHPSVGLSSPRVYHLLYPGLNGEFCFIHLQNIALSLPCLVQF